MKMTSANSKPFSYHVPRRKEVENRIGWTWTCGATISIYFIKILLLISLMGLIGQGSQDSSVPNFPSPQEYNVDFEESSQLPLISASSLAISDEDTILSRFEPMKVDERSSLSSLPTKRNQSVALVLSSPVVPLSSSSSQSQSQSDLPFISSENKSTSTFSDRTLNLDDELIPSDHNLISSSEEMEMENEIEIMKQVKKSKSKSRSHAHALWMNQSLLENQLLSDEVSSSDEQGHYDDSFSNEFSPASDRDKKYLSNVKRPRRSVMHLYDMVMCGTGGCNPLLYKGYGCYCGFLGSGIPVDGIDRCCAKHDWCYHHAKCPPLLTYFVPYYWTCNEGRPDCVSDFGGWKGICGAHLCECDRQFAQCLQKYPCPRARAMCMTSPWRFWQNLVMQPPLHYG